MTKILLTLIVVFLTGCSLFHRKNEPTTPPSAVEQSLEENKNLSAKSEMKPEKSEMTMQLKKIDALADQNTKHAKTSKKLDGVDPETALLWLKHGNTRFVKGTLRKDGQTKKDILRVSEKQRPHAIIFASSDSRVPPEIVFDQKLGEIFVIRNLGGALDSSVVSSIEYAMDHLGVRLLVLLGPAGTPSQRMRVIGNLEKIKEALPESSDLLKEKMASGELEAKTAVYDLKTGQVDFQ